MEFGYYLIKHYNYSDIQISLFDGTNFELFLSDKFIHDEIEWYQKIDMPKLIKKDVRETNFANMTKESEVVNE